MEPRGRANGSGHLEARVLNGIIVLFAVVTLFSCGQAACEPSGREVQVEAAGPTETDAGVDSGLSRILGPPMNPMNPLVMIAERHGLATPPMTVTEILGVADSGTPEAIRDAASALGWLRLCGETPESWAMSLLTREYDLESDDYTEADGLYYAVEYLTNCGRRDPRIDSALNLLFEARRGDRPRVLELLCIVHSSAGPSTADIRDALADSMRARGDWTGVGIALGRCDVGPEADALLDQLAQDPRRDVRLSAVYAVEERRDPALLGYIRHLVDDPDPYLANRARAIVLALTGDGSGQGQFEPPIDGSGGIAPPPDRPAPPLTQP